MAQPCGATVRCLPACKLNPKTGGLYKSEAGGGAGLGLNWLRAATTGLLAELRPCDPLSLPPLPMSPPPLQVLDKIMQLMTEPRYMKKMVVILAGYEQQV